MAILPFVTTNAPTRVRDLRTQITWTTGLGAINHILGPSDQDLRIRAPAARALHLGAAGADQWTIDTDGSLHAQHTQNNTMFAITQDGLSSAAVFANLHDNACLVLHAFGNSAALQIIQDDLEDSIDVGASDIRCRQVICSLACNVAHTGAVRFSDSVSILMPSPDYYDVLSLNASDHIVLGNTTNDYDIDISVDQEDISLIAGGATRFQVNDEGVTVLSSDFLVSTTARITAEGEAKCKMLSFGAEASKTISGGSITVSSGEGIIAVDTEAAAATDDLDTIAIDSSVEGNPILVIRGVSGARVVTLKDGTNLRLAGDFVLNDTVDRIVLLWTGSLWVELTRSDNA